MPHARQRNGNNGSSSPIIDLDVITDYISSIPTRDTPADVDMATESAMRQTWEEKRHDLLSHRYKGDTFTRKCLAFSTQAIIFGWLLCIIIILMSNESCFGLSDTVLITLLGTTTATVLGLALIVLNGFFRYMKQDVDLHDKHKS